MESSHSSMYQQGIRGQTDTTKKQMNMQYYPKTVESQQHPYQVSYSIQDLSSSPQRQVNNQDLYPGGSTSGISVKNAEYTVPGKVGYFVPTETTNNEITSLPSYESSQINLAKDSLAVSSAATYGGSAAVSGSATYGGSSSSYGMTKIRPPKGYNGPIPCKLNVDYGSYKAPEKQDQHGPPVVRHPPIASKPAIYKPRHNISEKDLEGLNEFEMNTNTTATQDFTEKNLPRELMSKMFGLLKENMFCDAVLFAGQKEIRIHKLVLMAASPFLLSKMANPRAGESIQVQLPSDIPIEVTSQLVHYLYDSKVTLTSQNVAQFARVAKLFNLEHLSKICQEFVQKFNLDKSVLNVPNEDISISIVGAQEAFKTQSQQIVEYQSTTESVKQVAVQKDVLPSTSNATSLTPQTQGSSCTVQLPHGEQTETSTKPSPSKPTHLYGTRTASGSVKKRVFDDAVIDKGDNLHQSNKKTAEKSVAVPNLQNNGKLTKEDTDKGNKSAAPSHIINHPRKRRLSMLAQETPESPLDDSVDDLLDDLDNDDDLDYVPPTITTQSGMQRAVFEGTRKGKTLKTLKKSTAYYQALKKGKKKTNQAFPSTSKTSTMLRPPPKKRAHEFAECETKEAETEIKEIENFLKADVEPLIKLPSKKPTATKSKPIPNVMASLGRYTAELEKRAANITSGDRHFICNLCENDFVFPKRCITHVVRTHELPIAEAVNQITIVEKKDMSPKKCEICGYVSKEKNQSYYYLHYHKYFRHGIPLPKGWEPFKCDVCQKEFFTKFQLKDHKLIHLEDTPFVCETCGTGFKSRTCLNSHVYHKHNTVKKHICHECDRAFKTKTQLMVHTRTHTGDKPFICPECNGAYRSTTRGNMRLHLNNKHKLPTDKIQVIMAELKPVTEVVIETDDPGSKFKPLKKAALQRSAKHSRKQAKKDDENVVPNVHNTVMVLNDQGQVDVLDNVKYIASDITKPFVEPPLDSIHPTITNMLSEPLSLPQGQGKYGDGNMTSGRQSLIQPYNMPVDGEFLPPAGASQTLEVPDSDDDEPQQLIINTEEFSPSSPEQFTPQNQGLHAKSSTDLLQDQNLALLSRDNSQYIGHVRNLTSVEMAANNQVVVQDLRQVGNELKTSNNEQILQLVTQPRQGGKAESLPTPGDKTDLTPITLPGGLQLHFHNIIRDKNQTFVQVQIQGNHAQSSNDLQVGSLTSIAPKGPQILSPVELVPVSYKRVSPALVPTSVYYHTVNPRGAMDHDQGQGHTSSSVAYIMQSPRDSGLSTDPAQPTSLPTMIQGQQSSVLTPVSSGLTQASSSSQNYADQNNVFHFYQNDSYPNC